jgi:hypothetical protein
MDEKQTLPPPDGYTSWLDYAVDTMETRDLFLQHCGGMMEAWKDCGDVQRSDMRDAAAEELSRLRKLEGDCTVMSMIADLNDRARAMGVQAGVTFCENEQLNGTAGDAT